ncbi:protein kinase domain containing protein [Entamoeba histolytica]
MLVLVLCIYLTFAQCYKDGTVTIKNIDSCKTPSQGIGDVALEQRDGVEDYNGFSWTRILLKTGSKTPILNIYDSSNERFLLQYDNREIITTTVNFYLQSSNCQWALYNNGRLLNPLNFYFYPEFEISDSKPFIFAPHGEGTFVNKNSNYITIEFDYWDYNKARVSGKIRLFIVSRYQSNYVGHVLTTTDSNVIMRPNYPNQVMCTLKNGAKRFGYNGGDKNEVKEDCTCTSVDGKWDKDDCTEFLQYFQVVVDCENTTSINEHYGGYAFKGCKENQLPIVTIPESSTVILEDMKIKENGVHFEVSGKLTISLTIPSSYPQILLNEVGSGTITVSSVTVESDIPFDQLLFISNSDSITAIGLTGYCSGGSYRRYAKEGSNEEVMCDCHFNENISGDYYIEVDCEKDSEYRNLILPTTREITASRTWKSLVTQSIFDISGKYKLKAGSMTITCSGTIKTPVEVTTLTSNKKNGIVFFGELTVTTINTDITNDVVLLSSSSNVGSLSKSCDGKINGSSRFYTGTDPKCNCEYSKNSFKQRDCYLLPKYQELYFSLVTSSYKSIRKEYYSNIISTSSFSLSGSETLTIQSCDFSSLKSVTIESSLYCKVMNVAKTTKIKVSALITIEMYNIPSEKYINDGAIISVTSPEYLLIKTVSGNVCSDIASSTKPFNSDTYKAVQGCTLLSNNKLLRYCPTSNTEDTVKCSMKGSDYTTSSSFDKEYCPCESANCYIYPTTTSIDLKLKSMENNFVIGGTSLTKEITNLKTITALIITSDSKNINILSTETAHFQSLIVDGKSNTISLGHSSSLISINKISVNSEHNQVSVYAQSISSIYSKTTNIIHIISPNDVNVNSMTYGTTTFNSVTSKDILISNEGSEISLTSEAKINSISTDAVTLQFNSKVIINSINPTAKGVLIKLYKSESEIKLSTGTYLYTVYCPSAINIKIGMESKTPISLESYGTVEFTSSTITLDTVNSGPSSNLIIGSDVTTFTLNKIITKKTYGEIFTLSPSTNQLTINLAPDYSSSITNPMILFYTRARRVNVDKQCDGVAVLSGSYSDEITTCKTLGLYNRECKLTDSGYIYNGFIDYSCPCSPTKSNCEISLFSSHSTYQYPTGLQPTTLILESDTALTSINNVMFILQTNLYSLTLSGNNSVVSISSSDISSILLTVTSLENGFILHSQIKSMTINTKALLKSTSKSYELLLGETTSLCDYYLFKEGYALCQKCKEGYILINNACYISTDIQHCTNYVKTTSEIKCRECSYGYYWKDGSCSKCSESNCIVCKDNDGTCIECTEGYKLINGVCTAVTPEITSCLYFKEYCYKCSNSLSVLFGSANYCGGCDSKCSNCKVTTDQCITCNINKKYMSVSGECSLIQTADLVSNNNIISCKSNYYLTSGECVSCSKKFKDCSICTEKTCITCSSPNAYITKDGSCEVDQNCKIYENNQCSVCKDGYFKTSEGVCSSCTTGCNKCKDSSLCLECSDSYYLTTMGKCVANELPNCELSSKKGCTRCFDHFYLDSNGNCQECNKTCLTCFKNASFCTSCQSDYYLDQNTCITDNGKSGKCSHILPGGKCAICKVGYYNLNSDCYECSENCTTCQRDANSCIECGENYYHSSSQNKCLSQDDLVYCISKNSWGCSKCLDGTYMYNGECYLCSDNCMNCIWSNICSSCDYGKVLRNGKCIPLEAVVNCIETSNGKCSKCSLNYKPTKLGDYCEFHLNVLIVILPIIGFIIILIVILCMAIILINSITRYTANKQREKEFTSFKMSSSSIHFVPLSNGSCLTTSMSEINFTENNVIPVGQETKTLLCIGNTNKAIMKVQITNKTDCESKYGIRSEPQLAFIKPGNAVEFNLFVKPYCTCKVDDPILIVSSDVKKSKEKTYQLHVIFETELTSLLDYDELKIDKKLGEGAFGIVFKGELRGNKVAIKQMKNMAGDSETIEEFEKEVMMLDKFRSDYIIHFYGAVFIPNKYCMVTEYAEYGSIQDSIHKYSKDKKPGHKLRIKFMIDAAKGIEYLHSNGILHRDIKPDNILIVSVNPNTLVNAKLTDFGSSRNVNMMMTNMTFTKGVGTPMYMAPEVLDQKKYKMPSDIFSFGVSLFEAYIWNTPYPIEKFKYPWDIAQFIGSGKRLEKPNKCQSGFIT